MDRLRDGRLHAPGVLLVDLGLPGMSGFEVVLEIRQRHKYLDRTPIVVVTSAEDLESQETAKAVGADAYIFKPVTLFSMMFVLKKFGRYGLEIHDRRAELNT